MQRRETFSKETNIWNWSIEKMPKPQNCLIKLYPLILQFWKPVQLG